MKILFISEVDLDGKSGQNIATNQIISAFSKNEDVELTLVCPKPNTQFEESINQIRNKYYLPKRKAKNLIWHLTQQVSMVKILIKAIRKEQPDHILVRLGTSTFVPPILAKIFRVNYVLLIRGLPQFSKKSFLHYYMELLFFINSKVASHVYTAYGEIKNKIDRFRTQKQKEAVVLTNAVDTERFYPVKKSIARSHLPTSINKNDFVIGFAGSIKKRHCLEDLINGVEKIYKEINVKVLIIGEGPELNNLKKMVESKNMEEVVIFLGFISHDKLNNYISACDLMYGVIHPEMVENPIKCYEYLACGKPVITSNKNEMKFIEKENIGVILDEVSSQKIAEAIISFNKFSDIEFEYIEVRAREYVEKYHTWKSFTHTIVQDLN